MKLIFPILAVLVFCTSCQPAPEKETTTLGTPTVQVSTLEEKDTPPHRKTREFNEEYTPLSLDGSNEEVINQLFSSVRQGVTVALTDLADREFAWNTERDGKMERIIVRGKTTSIIGSPNTNNSAKQQIISYFKQNDFLPDPNNVAGEGSFLETAGYFRENLVCILSTAPAEASSQAAMRESEATTPQPTDKNISLSCGFLIATE